MLDRYSDIVSHRTDADREQWGPRTERKVTAARHEMKFRIDKDLFAKLQSLAKIEYGVAKVENDRAGHISDNAELHYILETAINTYEEKYGSLPEPSDETAIQRHVRARTK